MTKRVSKPGMSLRPNNMPPLAVAYKSAMAAIFGYRPYVHKKSFPKFDRRQGELDNIGVSCRRYAYTVAKTWKSWCQGRGFKCMPVNLFCGPQALKSLEWQLAKPTVEISTRSEDEWHAMVHDECTIALTYIGYDGSLQLDDIRNRCARFLTYSNPDDDVRLEVLDLLSQRFGVVSPASYDDIILARRRNANHTQGDTSV